MLASVWDAVIKRPHAKHAAVLPSAGLSIYSCHPLRSVVVRCDACTHRIPAACPPAIPPGVWIMDVEYVCATATWENERPVPGAGFDEQQRDQISDACLCGLTVASSPGLTESVSSGLTESVWVDGSEEASPQHQRRSWLDKIAVPQSRTQTLVPKQAVSLPKQAKFAVGVGLHVMRNQCLAGTHGPTRARWGSKKTQDAAEHSWTWERDYWILEVPLNLVSNLAQGQNATSKSTLLCSSGRSATFRKKVPHHRVE
ncbi:hypothetical protein DFH27DRAFT_521393 [Peziza echinospora]|nr:hypothetical protein DFH27DRAFT_521393 [Peziza echinospora]